MQTVQLGDVMKIDRTAASDVECNALPYVGLEHIEKDVGNFIPDFRPQPETLLATKYRFSPRHVLYGKLRPYLNKVALPDFDGVCTTEIFPLLPEAKALDRGYLFGLLRSRNFVKWASDSVSGANLPRLDPERLREYEVTLPDLPEQRQIAQRLEQADRLRRTRRYALQLTDSLLPAAFLKLFGELKLTQELLGNHLEALEGGINFNPVGENDSASDWRVLKVSAVSWNDFLPEESKPISPNETFDDKLIVRLGDLIMSRANTVELVGAVACVRESPPKVLLPDKLWRLKFPATPRLLPDYVLYALRSRPVRREIEIRASGTSGSMKNISKDDVRELRLPLPPLPLQQKFAALVHRTDRLRAAQREALRQADHLFASLLHQAFRPS